MTTANRSDAGLQTEDCQFCQQETMHTVRLELRDESKQSQNAEFAKAPYRVTTCQRCGTEAVTRMNNI